MTYRRAINSTTITMLRMRLMTTRVSMSIAAEYPQVRP